jgi:hypothetical protein
MQDKREGLLNMKEVDKMDIEADYYSDLRNYQRRVNEFDKIDTERQADKRKAVIDYKKNKLALTAVSWRDGVKDIDLSKYGYKGSANENVAEHMSALLRLN